MYTAYLFFLYLPLYINSKVGYLDLAATIQRAADRWNFDFQLALASGDGYGDPRELGVMRAERATLEAAQNILNQVIAWLPVPHEEVTPAEALGWVQAWGAPEAYFDNGVLVKP